MAKKSKTKKGGKPEDNVKGKRGAAVRRGNPYGTLSQEKRGKRP